MTLYRIEGGVVDVFAARHETRETKLGAEWSRLALDLRCADGDQEFRGDPQFLRNRVVRSPFVGASNLLRRRQNSEFAKLRIEFRLKPHILTDGGDPVHHRRVVRERLENVRHPAGVPALGYVVVSGQVSGWDSLTLDQGNSRVRFCHWGTPWKASTIRHWPSGTGGSGGLSPAPLIS